jgi:hypothetical protein
MRGVKMAEQTRIGSILTGEITAKTFLKWKMIQIASILPLMVCVACLFIFKGSMLGTICFFLLLIVGFILPQVYCDMIQCHLLLKEEIKQMQAQGSQGD